MNSSFSVSDLGEFSPVDFNVQSVTKVSAATSSNSKHNETRSSSRAAAAAASASSKVDDEVQVVISPSLFVRRVDPTTRRIYPTVERLLVETHEFNLTTEAVTPALLAREERVKEKRARMEEREEETQQRRAAKQARMADGTRAPVSQQPTQRSGSVATPAVSADSDRVRSSSRLLSRSNCRNGVTMPGTGQQQQSVMRPTTTKAGVAMVRLSSGKIVQVPMDVLRQHQARLNKARDGGGDGPTTNGVSAGTPRQARLSQVLAKITPPSTTTPSVPTATASPPVSSLITRQQPATQQQHRQPPVTSMSSVPLPPSVSNLLKNGRLPPLPPPLSAAGAQAGQRLVKIRAHPGPPPTRPNGVPASVAGSPNRLSDRLSSLAGASAGAATTTATATTGSLLPPAVAAVVSAATGQPASQQSLKWKSYSGPNVVATGAKVDAGQQQILVNGQRLSSVLGGVMQQQPPVSSQQQQQQQQAGSPVKIVTSGVPSGVGSDRFLVLGPPKNGQPTVSKVQLGPALAKRAGTGPGAQAVAVQIPQSMIGPGGNINLQRTLTSLSAQGVQVPLNARAIVVHHSGPTAGQQQVVLGSPQKVGVQVQQQQQQQQGGSPQPQRVMRLVASPQKVAGLGVASPQRVAGLVSASPQRVSGIVVPRGAAASTPLASPQRATSVVTAGGSPQQRIVTTTPGSPQKVIVGPVGDVRIVTSQPLVMTPPPPPIVLQQQPLPSTPTRVPPSTPPPPLRASPKTEGSSQGPKK